MTIEWTMPPGMPASHALEDIAELALQCVEDDGVLVMTKPEALGFIGLLRNVARAARLAEMLAAGVPSPILQGNVVGLRPRRISPIWPGDPWDAA